MKGYLLLADGTQLHGTLAGSCKPALGELVFNTAMTGYQEILTDPSYHRQIVVLTHPEIGNYGCDPNAVESDLGHASGMVFRNLNPKSWHRRNTRDFDAEMRHRGVTAIAQLDTRKLTRMIRDQGPQNALIAPAGMPLEEAHAQLQAAPSMSGACLIPEVSTREIREVGAGRWHIVLLDFGIKAATIKSLVTRDCRVTQVPWNTSLTEIAALKPDGIMLSNGPGDPGAVPHVRETIAQLIERYPVMGICMGFQLMALALKGRTYKLPFGHHGGNHPVRFQNRVVITSQNHGFAVDPDSLDQDIINFTHTSLFDHSLEGFELRNRPVFGVQFHPEAAPGPHDCLDHFDYFMKLVEAHAQKS